MNNYQNRLYELQDELWVKFDNLVQVGAKLPAISVDYPFGNNPEGLSINSDGRSWFLAIELVANPNYLMNIGEHTIVRTESVEFIDNNGVKHNIEPDIVDLHWLAELIDTAVPNKST